MILVLGSGKVQTLDTCNNCSGHGKISHSLCNGRGYLLQTYNCAHGKNGGSSHYYCSSHGNDVQQYH